MKKSWYSAGLIAVLILFPNCSGEKDTAFEKGWTHFKELTLMRDIDFDSSGHLWAAGYKGVADLDPRKGTFVHYTSENGLTRTESLVIEAAPDDTIWVGMKRAGTAYFADGKWVSCSPGGAGKSSDICTVYSCGDGSVWVGTIEGDGGLDVYDGIAWKHMSESDGLSEKYIIDMAEADDGSLWFLTYSQGVCVKDKSGGWTYYDTDDGLKAGFFEAIDISVNGTVWIGTTTGGAYRFEGSTWTRFTSEDGLIDDSILSVRAHPDGSVWFGTPKGASRFDGEEWTQYTTENGLLTDYIEHIEIAPDGTICFATPQAISCLKTE